MDFKINRWLKLKRIFYNKRRIIYSSDTPKCVPINRNTRNLEKLKELKIKIETSTIDVKYFNVTLP